MDEERTKILKMLQAGQINAEQAAMLLTAARPAPGVADGDEATPAGEPLPAGPAARTPGAADRLQERWATFWIYPLLVGSGVVILGSLVMVLTYAAHAARFWRMCCGWLPLTVGAVIVLLAWWSRRAKWLHVRVREQDGRKVAISLPLPLTLVAWVLRIVQPFVPKLRDTGVDDLIIALRDSPPGQPLSVDVEDGEDGEQVQVYFG